MESFLTTLARLIAAKSLPALMIGGHAVTALGHPRATYDVDLLVPRSSAPRWRQELATLHYRLFAESPNFQQFEPAPDLPLPPLDLMLVDDDVFAVFEQSKVASLPLATPGVLALIALKLHAIRQPSREDPTKDWTDVLALIKHHELSLDDPEFAAIVLKHGGPSAIQIIQHAFPGRP